VSAACVSTCGIRAERSRDRSVPRLVANSLRGQVSALVAAGDRAQVAVTMPSRYDGLIGCVLGCR
jgi:hypothetical protein